MPAELRFFGSGDESFAALENDPGRSEDVKRLNLALDRLEADPSDGWARRIRFQNGLWAIRVRGVEDDYIILWDPHPEDSSIVLIHYVGPEPS